MRSLIFLLSLGVMFCLYAVFNHEHTDNDVSLSTQLERPASTTVNNPQEQIDNFPIVTLPTPPFRQDAPSNIQSQSPINLELIFRRKIFFLTRFIKVNLKLNI